MLIIDGKWSNELHRRCNDGCLDGAAGLSSSKGFKAVHDTSRKILACVLEVLEAKHGDNVVSITR